MTEQVWNYVYENHMLKEKDRVVAGISGGADASRESRRLIELLERFLEAGVGKDTALKLINSTEVYERKGYSTLDVC